MSALSELIREAFSDYAIYKDKSANSLFAGRTLPNFVKDYVLNRFSNGEERDDEAIRKYLDEKMPVDANDIQMRLMDGEIVNITTKVVVLPDMGTGKVAFALPELSLNSKMYIGTKVLKECRDELTEGENWGNLTMQYMPPEGRKSGYVLMTSFKTFNPYRNLNFDQLTECRKGFSIDEWIDVILATMGYEPDVFPTMESKFMMISRLLPMVQPNLNFIELGPKASGKSFVYNNLSPHVRMISGKATRAQLVYNHSTKQYGAIKYNDLIVFDEVTTLEFDDRTQELQNFLKSFLEAGHASLANVRLASSCGIGLAGNIALTEELKPVNNEYVTLLPDIFRTSAMLDRFHLFIPGWLVPKISEGQLYYGWAIDNEVFSEYMHYLRRQSYSEALFDELVTYDKTTAYVRHVRSVKKVASAYCKLLFPHVKSLADLTEEELEIFKILYRDYCLVPAIEARTYIYNELKAIDAEFRASTNAIPDFQIPIEEQLPEDELPEDELPEDELPEDELPEDELPDDESEVDGDEYELPDDDEIEPEDDQDNPQDDVEIEIDDEEVKQTGL